MKIDNTSILKPLLFSFYNVYILNDRTSIFFNTHTENLKKKSQQVFQVVYFSLSQNKNLSIQLSNKTKQINIITTKEVFSWRKK